MLFPLICSDPDEVTEEGGSVDILGATLYVGESGDATPRGNRHYRRMLKLRPHRDPIIVHTRFNGNDEIVDANSLRDLNE